MSKPIKHPIKPSERQLLHTLQNTVVSAILSMVVAERVGYTITPRTQFNVNPDFTEVEISEKEDSNEGVVKAPE